MAIRVKQTAIAVKEIHKVKGTEGLIFDQFIAWSTPPSLADGPSNPLLDLINEII
ncbi:MAG: hypothetical protein NPIRA05_19970 [Nitrospirales bacterium]|nr:MAG: hypothetical protein NPIRA05_19970 [Nitrospirales bacterium]